MQLLLTAAGLFCAALTAVASASSGPTIVPLTQDGGYLFGSFDVGESKNLSLVIHTDEWRIYINSGRYKPTSESKPRKDEAGWVQGSSYFCARCDVSEFNNSVYSDVFSVRGLKITNQTFANDVKPISTKGKPLVEFPHDGFIGFQGARPDVVDFGGQPFLQSLCKQG